MPEGSSLFCDVSLPVPLDQLFTYALPETLRHRVRAGSRIVVPFGPRKLTGVILRCPDEPPSVPTREAQRIIDSEPVLGAELLALGRWIANYYCAPLGEVLRGMLPLASEIRRGKIWSLTDSGRDAARQLLLETTPDDPVVAASATRYLQGREPVILPAELSSVTLQSPERFATYALATMFATLPPLKETAPVAAAGTSGRKAAKAH